MINGEKMKTRIGRYQVGFSIPTDNGFLAFHVEDIRDLGHAQTIERALLDGGCTAVHLAIRTDSKDQAFVAVYPSGMQPGFVKEASRKLLEDFRISRKRATVR